MQRRIQQLAGHCRCGWRLGKRRQLGGQRLEWHRFIERIGLVGLEWINRIQWVGYDWRHGRVE
jgi:hypothetical protein